MEELKQPKFCPLIQKLKFEKSFGLDFLTYIKAGQTH